MDELRFEINWGQGFVTVNAPRNWESIKIGVLWTDGEPSAVVQGTDFEWVEDNAAKLWAWRRGGLVGTLGSAPGIFEGPGLRIWTCGSFAQLVFDGLIDLSNQKTRWECDMISAPSMESGKRDWLDGPASAFDFEYLRSLTGSAPGRIIPATDYKRTPYVITAIPDYEQAMIVAISLFVTLKELYDVTNKIAALINELTGQGTTAIAQAGTSAATVVATVANVVLYVVYLFLIVLILVDLIKDLISNIIQLKKYKLCMRVETLFQRACAYLNLVFTSTIITSGNYYDTTVMPRKSVMPSTSNPLNIFDRPFDENQGFPNSKAYGHYEGTFKQFILDMCKVFNAEVVLTGGVLHFRERHDYNATSNYQVPNVALPGFTANLPDPHETNADELAKHYFMGFSLDQTELNTLHKYRGTTVACTLSPLNTVNRQHWLLKKNTRVDLPFARANGKKYLTRVENLLNNVINGVATFVNFIVNSINGLINAVNWVINLFGGNPAAIGTIPTMPTNIVLNARMNWMELSNDSFGVPKIFIGQKVGNDWVVSPNNDVYMTAVALFNRFHSRNLATRGNQSLVYRERRFSMCCADFIAIRGNNIFRTPSGQYGKFRKINWDVFHEEATDVEYEIFTNFTNNLQEKIIVDGSV